MIPKVAPTAGSREISSYKINFMQPAAYLLDYNYFWYTPIQIAILGDIIETASSALAIDSPPSGQCACQPPRIPTARVPAANKMGGAMLSLLQVSQFVHAKRGLQRLMSRIVLLSCRAITVSVLILVTMKPMSFAQSVSFGSTPKLPIPGAVFLAAGDFNGDGKQDLVTVNNILNLISIYLGDGAGGFGAGRNFPVGTYPEFAAAADLNRDGKLDLVVTNAYSGNVSILLGDGAGSFGTSINYPVGGPFGSPGPSSVAIGDLNRDNNLDLVVTNAGTQDVSVLLGDGAGRFGAPLNFALGTQYSERTPVAVALADLNNDGKLDSVVANRDSAELSILLGDGAGSLGLAGNVKLPGSPLSVSVGDFNKDGKMDLAVAMLSVYGPLPPYVANGYVSIFYGDGAGQFALSENVAAGISPAHAFVADFNRDGNLDLAVINYGSLDTSILFGNGKGSFAAAISYAVGYYPYAAVISDFNGDSISDIAVSNPWSNDVSMLLGSATGSFDGAQSYVVGNAPAFVAVDDFDSDGLSDLAVTNHDSGTVSILRGNGVGSFQAAGEFAVQKGPVSVATGDFNQDGKPDLAVANEFSDTVSILQGDGNGSFNPVEHLVVGSNPVSVKVADVNSDGKPDVLVANAAGNSVAVVLGAGNGFFDEPRTFSVGSVPVSIATGDLNGDGKIDLAVGGRFSPQISILLGDGTGLSWETRQIDILDSVEAIQIADFNKDGKLDLAVVGSTNHAVYILLGKGDGSFGRPKGFSVGDYPFWLAVDDFNGDDNLDIATADLFGHEVSILLGDGKGSFGTARNLELRRYPAAVATGDFNRDGMPDIVVPNIDTDVITVALNTTVPPLTLRGSSSIETETNVSYVSSLLIGGGKPPYTIGIVGGSLPTGFSIVGQNIVGTATRAEKKSFTLQIADQKGTTTTKRHTIQIYPALKALTSELKVGVIGRSYSGRMKATGGKSPYTWSLSSGRLPAGIAIEASSGRITGIPTETGSFNLTFQVQDPLGGVAQKTLTLSVR